MSGPAVNGNANGSRRRGLLLVGVVFILGLVCGSALTVIGVRTVLPERPARHVRGGPMHRGPMEPFRELDLDPGQKARVREILDRSRGEVHTILEQSRADIRTILTDEQREKFDEMRRHRRPMRGRRHGPPE